MSFVSVFRTNIILHHPLVNKQHKRVTCSKTVPHRTKKAIYMSELNEQSFEAILESTGLMEVLAFYQLLRQVLPSAGAHSKDYKLISRLKPMAACHSAMITSLKKSPKKRNRPSNTTFKVKHNSRWVWQLLTYIHHFLELFVLNSKLTAWSHRSHSHSTREFMSYHYLSRRTSEIVGGKYYGNIKWHFLC